MALNTISACVRNQLGQLINYYNQLYLQLASLPEIASFLADVEEKASDLARLIH